MIRSDAQLNAARHRLARMRKQLADTYGRLTRASHLLNDAQMLADQIDELDHDIEVASWMLQESSTVLPPIERVITLTLRASDAMYALRTRAHLTQDHLAQQLSTSQSHIARLESELREDHSTLQIERWAGACGHLAYPVRFISQEDPVEAALAVLRLDLATLDSFLRPNDLQTRASHICRRLRALTSSSVTVYTPFSLRSSPRSADSFLVGSGLMTLPHDVRLRLEPDSAPEAVVRVEDAKGALRTFMEQQFCKLLVHATTGPGTVCIGFRLHSPSDEHLVALRAICRGTADLLRYYEAGRDKEAASRQLFEMFHHLLGHIHWRDIEYTMSFMKDLHCMTECDLVFIALEQPQDANEYWVVSEHHLREGRTLVYFRPEGATPRGMRERLAARLRDSRRKAPNIWSGESDEEVLSRVREIAIPKEDFAIVRDTVLLASTVTATLGYRWDDANHRAHPLADRDLTQVVGALQRNGYLITEGSRSTVVSAATKEISS